MFSSTTAPFDIVHIDILGHSSTIYVEGFKCYLVIVDDFTRYSCIYPMKLKSEVATMFPQFIALVERQFNSKVISVHCDMGTEFVGLHKLFDSLGINARHSYPYTHQQNGLVEINRQHIIELGLSMMAHSKVYVEYWWFAFHTAVFLINILHTPVLKNISPFQALSYKLPDYSHLRVFCCACFPLLRLYNSSKLQFRSDKCVFLEYSPLPKGYRCLHKSRKIYISDIVAFHESEFPFECFSNSTILHLLTTVLLSFHLSLLIPLPHLLPFHLLLMLIPHLITLQHFHLHTLLSILQTTPLMSSESCKPLLLSPIFILLLLLSKINII